MRKVDSRSEQKGHALLWTCPARTWKCLSNSKKKKKFKEFPSWFIVTQLLYVKSKAIQQPCLVPVKISCLSITLSAVSCDEGLTFSCSLPSFCSGFCWNEADGVIKTHAQNEESRQFWEMEIDTAARNEDVWSSVWSEDRADKRETSNIVTLVLFIPQFKLKCVILWMLNYFLLSQFNMHMAETHAFRHLDVVRTTCWSSNRASE